MRLGVFMSKAEINNLVNEITDKLHRLADRTLQALNEETAKAMTEANKEFGLYQQQKIEQIFDEAVTRFYNDYLPSQYVRSGSTSELSGGLYDVLNMPLDESGIVVYNKYEELLDGSKMSIQVNPSRRAAIYDIDGLRMALFEQTFMEGWHGGAKTISSRKSDKWGAHPAPGTPYYRAPGRIRTENGGSKWHRWGKWGKRATRTTAPFTIFSKNLSAAEGAEIFEKFKEISQRHNDTAVQKVQSDIPKFKAEIYG